ncbi:hypothetical protein GCM10022381_30330 [Leifsonia kafniensis]|uniref:Uncharacterized protein n=1 Tax=Leifsonia kafniensis TaxID=475957 RepID=A0ABP7KRM5_9MICO
MNRPGFRAVFFLVKGFDYAQDVPSEVRDRAVVLDELNSWGGPDVPDPGGDRQVLGGINVTSHDRAWARRLTITDPDHVAQAAVLRRQFQTLHRDQRPQARVVFVESASLSSYDDLFGVDTGHGLGDLRLA